MINMHDPIPKAPAMKGIRRPPRRSRTKTWKVSTPATLTTPKNLVTRLAALSAPTEEKNLVSVVRQRRVSCQLGTELNGHCNEQTIADSWQKKLKVNSSLIRASSAIPAKISSKSCCNSSVSSPPRVRFKASRAFPVFLAFLSQPSRALLDHEHAKEMRTCGRQLQASATCHCFVADF